MAKPSEGHISWTDGSVSKVDDPGGAKKLVGWEAAERPAFKYMNWLFYVVDLWLKYFEEVTDVSLAANYAAVVNSSTGTHATLQAAHDDAGVVPGSRILVTEDAALDGTVNLTKADLEIEFAPGVTYSKGGGAAATNFAGISIGASADGIRFKHGRFAGFIGSGDRAIDLDVGADYAVFLNPRFGTNTTDIEDNSNTTYSTIAPINE